MASKSLTLMIEFLADVKKVLEESPEGNVFDLSFGNAVPLVVL